MFLDRTQLDTHNRKESSERVISPSQKTLPIWHTEKVMPSVEFEPATLTVMRQLAYALETMATGIGPFYITGDWWHGWSVLRSFVIFLSEKFHNFLVQLLCIFWNVAAWRHPRVTTEIIKSSQWKIYQHYLSYFVFGPCIFIIEGRTDQRNAQINFSLINLLLFNYSDMFRLLNWSHPQGV